jgi:Putative restriction endonuclease
VLQADETIAAALASQLNTTLSTGGGRRIVATAHEGATSSLWRMPRSRYDQLVEAGIFGPDDRIELLDGLRIAREPQGERHATVVGLVRAALEKAFGGASRPVLVVEVADTSLALDRLRKGGLYARARIADYWVVNLIDEVLEVYREPVRVTPSAAPRAPIRVAALLP